MQCRGMCMSWPLGIMEAPWKSHMAFITTMGAMHAVQMANNAGMEAPLACRPSYPLAEVR